MDKKINPAQLESEIAEILKDYGDLIIDVSVDVFLALANLHFLFMLCFSFHFVRSFRSSTTSDIMFAP